MDENKILESFSPITLAEMKDIKLMNRTDTKYVTTRNRLAEWLELAREEYFVQDMGGQRLMPYHTIYLDTPDRKMYLDHHNGHLHRQKVRFREYEVDHKMFLEVKDKNNHGRTKKKRIVSETSSFSDTEQKEWVDSLIMNDAYSLVPQIENHFYRITLVNKGKTERLTIDLDLQFKNLVTGVSTTLPDHVIIELKRDGMTYSPAINLLNKMRIKRCGFSKYCIGMALTDSSLKQNRFKERIHYIEKLKKQNY